MNNDELANLRSAQNQGTLQLSSDGKSTINVLLGDGSTYSHSGTLDFSSVTVDPSTGSVSLRAILPNPEHALLPGSFVSFLANLGARNNAYLVPQPAVQRDATGAYVLVVGQDGKVARKDVTTDTQQQGQWVVTSGLAAGDQVIVDGLQKAQPGQPAKAVPYAPKAQGAPNGQAPAAAPSEKK
jgi:membrane fusion protein (multidrug efflux system)